MARNRSKCRHGGNIAGLELQCAQVARPRATQPAKRNQRVAFVGVHVAEPGVRFQELINVIERLSRSLEALQAQGQGITRADIARRNRNCTLKMPQCVLEFACVLEARRNHVQEQRMLEAICQSLLGDRSGARPVAILRIPQNRVEHGLVSFQVARHGFSLTRISPR